MVGRPRARVEGIRERAKRLAAGEERLFSEIHGRETTATGNSAMIWVQPRQRWKLARLSAPMIQTKCTPGNRAVSARRVSMVYWVPILLSASETIMARPRATRRAPATLLA